MESPQISSEFAQVLASAATFRAAEIAYGKEFTQDQVRLYLANYRGKYSQKIMQAGVGVIVVDRQARDRIGTRIRAFFGGRRKPSNIIQQIEECAMHSLTVTGMRDRMRKLVENDFKQ